MKYLRANDMADSFVMNRFSLDAKRAALSSRRRIVNFFMGANLDFATSKFVLKLPPAIFHLMYAQAPNARSDASLKTTRTGFLQHPSAWSIL